MDHSFKKLYSVPNQGGLKIERKRKITGENGLLEFDFF
jgi:hypothetical protein